MNLTVYAFVFINCKNSISFKPTYKNYFSSCNKLKNELSDKHLNFNNNSRKGGANKNKPRFDNKWKEILGRSGANKHSHILAIEQLNSGKPVTAKTINDILAYSNITTSENELKRLLNTPCFVLHDLHKKNNTIRIIKENIASPSDLFSCKKDKETIPGIYIFTHLITGSKYVGSSLELAHRLSGYIVGRHTETGLLIPLLKKEKLQNFSLQVFPLHDNYTKGSETILEQYHLLNPTFTLNTIKVANNPAGSNAKTLYLYNRDKTLLYYHSTQQIDFIRKLNLHHTTFTRHLNNGTYYLGKYLFLREPVLTAGVKDLSDTDLAFMLQNDRKKYNINKPLNSLSKTVLLTDVNNSNNRKLYTSLGKCVGYLQNKNLSANKTNNLN